MEKTNEKLHGVSSANYNAAVHTIKNAILYSQYQAAKLVNREMLSLYFGIGRYISANSRNHFWGTGAIKTISERLKKELPGLKGFSETSIRNMRIFYEEWTPVIFKSAVMTADLQSIDDEVIAKSSAAADDLKTPRLLPSKSLVITNDLQSIEDEEITNSSVATDEFKTPRLLPCKSAAAAADLQSIDNKTFVEISPLTKPILTDGADKSSVMTDNLQTPPLLPSSVATDEIDTTLLLTCKSPVATGDFETFLNLDFTHHMAILNGVKNYEKRLKYIRLSVINHWSTKFLQQQIKDNAADRYGTLPSNFAATLGNTQNAVKAINMFKDSYLLDFINVEEIGIRDREDIDERVVEKEVIHNIKKFIMTFGRDFAFVGNQYHLEAYTHEFFPDLLFFNRELNCLVVIELKTGDFKTGYLAQLMTYLRILDDKVKKPHENPSVGIVLCKDADKDFVEYVIQDYAKPMGVATYRLHSEMPQRLREALPNVEELRKLL